MSTHMQKVLATRRHNAITDTIAKNIVDRFLEEEVGPSSSSLTVDAYRNDLAKFTLFYQSLNNSSDLAQWCPLDSRKFIDELQRQGYAATSINRALATLKRFGFWLCDEGILTKNPVMGVRGPAAEEQEAKNLTDVEIHRLRKAAIKLVASDTARYHQSFRNMVILELLLASGLRVSEVTGLKANNQLIGKKIVNIRCKGNRIRNILIRQQVADLIREYITSHRIDGCDYLFTSWKGTVLDRRAVAKALNKVGSLAEVKVWPHLFRHAHARRVREKFGDAYTAKRLGHASTKHVERYAGHAKEDDLKIESVVF